MRRCWVPHDIRDQVVDFMNKWSQKTGFSLGWMLQRADIPSSKFYHWRQRYGRANEHNRLVPRDFWLEPWECQAIIDFQHHYPLEGYRRLTFMMLDRDIVAVSPSSVYRVLRRAGLIQSKTARRTGRGKGFVQPLQPHEHWHIDISHLNICGTFYYLCSILDGASRYIVHWEIHPAMNERDVEMVVQRALERFPEVKPRIISDNGPQFVAKDFKEFLRLTQLSHVTTSPYYPQSNGKKERWYKTLKGNCIRIKTPLSLEQARKVVEEYVEHYNNVRLHSAIGYVTPKDRLENRQHEIHRQRDEKLDQARQQRKINRQQQRSIA